MTELTPQNEYPIPSEFEEPYYPTMRSYFLATDMADWAMAENAHMVWTGGGSFAWNAVDGILTWTNPVEIRTKTSVWATTIPGPPSPGGTVVLQNGECAFFQHPRQMVSSQTVTLSVGPITQLPGTRLHDITLFATRVGDIIFFAQGQSLKAGEAGEIFGAGTGSTVQPHEHQPAKVIEPPLVGTTILDLNVISFAPANLKRIRLFRNGSLQHNPDDYSVDLNSGLVTLVESTKGPSIANPDPERFIALMETTPPIVTTGEHQHLAPRVIEPASGTFQLDMLITSSDYPSLQRVEVHRNGAAQAEPDDYSVDLVSGLVTLVIPSTTNERFTCFREVQY